ncbi:MAG: serine/threonine-protein phosphatase [Anaerolineales bacterium]|nr:serine/threonine-protein phosphatase [Anaerolineales bacterium]
MIRLPHAHLKVAALSHAGMTGKQNEDNYAVSAFQLDHDDPTPVVFAIVSDGIGGHRAGEVASELAVEAISRVVAESDGSQPQIILQEAIQATSRMIAAQARDDTQRLGMGTTCVCALVVDDRFYTASVGDSRIYLLRGGAIRQLTTDHTWIQEALDRGILTPEEAHNHPNVHVIRRYLGSPQPPEADLRLRLGKEESDSQAEANQGTRMEVNDILLLCTDGLTDLVMDQEILTLVNGSDLETAAQALVNMACERGGYDNITVLLMTMPFRPRARRIPARLRARMAITALLLLLLAAVLGVLAWYILEPAVLAYLATLQVLSPMP